jgi:ribosome modulation factor
MGRKRKQTDIEDAINGANGHAKTGHNSALSDDERRALTLHHKGLYEAADALVEKAKADRTSVADLAKADLGKGAISDIKDMIANSDDKKLKASLERTLRLARWLGMPVGTQVNMFEAPVEDRAAEDGRTAGMEGKACDPPRHLAVTASQRWIGGWHEGQTVLASAFKKLRPEPQPDEAPPPAEAAQPESEQMAAH